MYKTIVIIIAYIRLYAFVYCQRINTRENRHTHHRTQINEFLIDNVYRLSMVYAGVIIYVF
nr:MAG TPA: hypothetical protein [Caudoviricetes sp.]